MTKRIIIVIYLIAFAALPRVIYADAEQQTLEQIVGETLIRVSYDQEKAGVSEPVPFTFDLLKPDESNQVPFDSVMVNIKSKETNRDLFIADVVKASSGLTSITYDFPKTGEYAFTIRYKGSGVILAEHSFDFVISKDTAETGFDQVKEDQIEVTAVNKSSEFNNYLWIAALVLGLGLGWFLKTIRARR